MAQRVTSGFIVYRGPSLINGAPIVVVAITKKSSNSKTGNMVQTYILADNGLSPVVNARTLADEAICGDCPHRRGKGGACYVNLGQGPRAVADGVVRGIYPFGLHEAMEASSGRMVRLGTYGDPAAVPAEVWENLVSLAAGHTGYTHQWRRNNGADLSHLVMASADSLADRQAAQAAGFRTFRIRTAEQPVDKGEFTCPASAEGGKRKTCATCGACNGTGERGTAQASAVIVVHGSLANRFIARQTA